MRTSPFYISFLALTISGCGDEQNKPIHQSTEDASVQLPLNPGNVEIFFDEDFKNDVLSVSYLIYQKDNRQNASYISPRSLDPIVLSTTPPYTIEVSILVNLANRTEYFYIGQSDACPAIGIPDQESSVAFEIKRNNVCDSAGQTALN